MQADEKAMILTPEPKTNYTPSIAKHVSTVADPL